MTSSLCAICREGFGVNESVVNANGVHWHQECFVCVQVSTAKFSINLLFNLSLH